MVQNRFFKYILLEYWTSVTNKFAEISFALGSYFESLCTRISRAMSPCRHHLCNMCTGVGDIKVGVCKYDKFQIQIKIFIFNTETTCLKIFLPVRFPNPIEMRTDHNNYYRVFIDVGLRSGTMDDAGSVGR